MMCARPRVCPLAAILNAAAERREKDETRENRFTEVSLRSKDLNTVSRLQDRLKTIPRLSFSVPRVHFDPTRGILLFRVAGFYSFSPNSMFQLGEEFAQLGEEFVQLGESLGELGESLNGVGEKSVQVGVKSVDLGESNSGNSS
jgi:hypothetical protein